MKTLKHLALAALVIAALLLPSAMTRPRQASADSCDSAATAILTGSLIVLGCAGTSQGNEPCVLSAVDANGSTPDLHKYTYVLTNCFHDVDHVQGEYNVGQQTAHEQLNYAGPTFTADWACPGGDPWSYDWSASRPAPCTNTSLTQNEYFYGQPLSTGNIGVVPLSTLNISVADHNTLNDALSDALTQWAIQAFNAAAAKEAAKQAAIHAALFPTTTTATCAACSVSSSPPAGEATSVTAAGSAAASALGTTPAPAPAPAAYHNPSIGADGWPQLSTYTQGEAVTSLQYLLQKSAPALPADGKFGPGTNAAVRAFQAAQGIVVDGVVGQQTWLALIVTVQQGSKGAAVQAVQSQLKSRGQAVTVDGNFGSQTDAAVRKYQQGLGLTVDGQVGPQTWQPLLVGS